ncbi:hypothetical protein B0H66DRAFT_600864 [Apodospora peruviana]|uniref:Uncharacterized protein n=1 Tax=Apodospora peruviana TaxID=516989 RepID=A0AAE0IL31_9PEZI|nr:hypothetical protein B0H66DRAFT_600864 [Apodospora peruviana]
MELIKLSGPHDAQDEIHKLEHHLTGVRDMTERKRSGGSDTHVRSAHLLPILSDLDCDVLLLFDSCQAIPPNLISAGECVVSVLGATGFDPGIAGVAPGVGPHLFTRALIDELASLMNHFVKEEDPQPTSDIALHGNLLGRLELHLSTIEKDPSGRLKRENNGGVVFEAFRRRRPTYRFLSENKNPKPIYIAPLPISMRSITGTEEPQDKHPRKGKEVEGIKLPMSAEEGLPTSSLVKEKDVPRMLIRVLLNTSTFSIDQFATWLLQALPEARNVEIEGAYRSLSTLLIFNMSLSVWNLVPRDPAISLVRYITPVNKAGKINREIRRKLDTGGTSSLSATRGTHPEKTTSRSNDPRIAMSGLRLFGTSSHAVYPSSWPTASPNPVLTGGPHYRCEQCRVEIHWLRHEGGRKSAYTWFCHACGDGPYLVQSTPCCTNFNCPG